MANSVIDSKGRVWIPEELLKRLGVEGSMTADVDSSCGVIVIRPVEAVPCEDEWAYTPQHLAVSASALRHIEAGETFQMSEQDLIDSVNGEVAPE